MKIVTLNGCDEENLNYGQKATVARSMVDISSNGECFHNLPQNCSLLNYYQFQLTT